MSDNVYSAPDAKLINEASVDVPPFYVVGSRKFWILFFASFSLYLFYWFYKNWSNYRLRSDVTMWPVPRAIFSIFFTHSLFRKIDNTLQEAGASYSWSPRDMASLYVFLTITSSICSRLADNEIGLPYTLIAYMLAVPLVGWPIFSAQKAANIACEDPRGHSNNRMTAANIVWIVIFGLLWALAIFGTWAIYTEVA